MPFSIKRVLVDERNRPFCLVSGVRSSASPSHPAVWPYGLNHEEGTASIRQMFLMPTGGVRLHQERLHSQYLGRYRVGWLSPCPNSKPHHRW